MKADDNASMVGVDTAEEKTNLERLLEEGSLAIASDI